jgi:predicted adenylyl cyclase CyaB
MGQEIEAKVRVSDAAAVERAVAALGAEYGGAWVEVDAFFEHPDRRLLDGDSALRMRISQPLDETARRLQRAAMLTYKGPREPGRLKVRAEHQVNVPDPAAMREILRGLDYSEAFSYEKRRRRWRFEDAEITLDELPLLGFFVEVEAPDETRIDGLLDRLGLGDRDVLTTSYVQMLRHRLGESSNKTIRFAD